jgi:hypothetical protein
MGAASRSHSRESGNPLRKPSEMRCQRTGFLPPWRDGNDWRFVRDVIANDTTTQRDRRPKTDRAVRYFWNKPPPPGVNSNDQEGKRALAVGAGKWYRMGVMDTVRTAGMALERALPATNE